jgi:hypothetical protein
LFSSKEKPPFNQLHGPLQSDSNGRQDQVKMVWHHNKLMQEILVLLPVTEQDFVAQFSQPGTGFSSAPHLWSQSMWTRWLPLDEELSNTHLSG